MIRRVALAGIITAALVAPLALTAPAGAGSHVGCSGNECSVLLTNVIPLAGDWQSGPPQFPPYPSTPPPCLWEPIGDAVTGSQYIIRNYGAIGPNSYFGVSQAVLLAKKLLKQNPPPAGTWYELPTNPAAPKAAQQQCQKLPLFYFDRPGQALPGVPVSPLWLAEYAYNHILLPRPRLTTNPATKGYVNLATFAWARWGPRSRATNSLTAYRVTATLGALTVSVWAQPSGFTLGVSGAPASAYTLYTQRCGVRGSAYPRDKSATSAGPGTPPDCGILWRGPAAAATIVATETWTATWGMGVLNGPTGRKLRPISLTGAPKSIRVEEIQSVNGG
jgi:hypothetical protein